MNKLNGIGRDLRSVLLKELFQCLFKGRHISCVRKSLCHELATEGQHSVLL